MTSPKRTSLGRSSLDNVNFELPPSPREGSLPQYVKKKSIEQEIKEYANKIKNKIFIVKPSGERHIGFLRVTNKKAEPFYIQIDTPESYISQTPQDIFLRESGNLSLPSEEKEEAFQKVGMGVAGIAIECRNGLCTITRNEPQAPVERSFVLIHTKRFEEDLIMGSFPLVKLSELRLNPEACLKNIGQALRKIRDTALDKCYCEVKEVEKKVKELYGLFNETMCVEENAIRGYKRSMGVLENNLEKCLCKPECNEERIKEILYNIERRNSLFPILIESCQDIGHLNHELDEALCLLEKIKVRLAKKFKNIDYVYEPKVKGKYKYCVEEMTSSESEY